MLELVLANLKTRPLRTLISVVGVALSVILVMLFTGLARGMTQDMVHRATNWKAEIVFTRSGGMEVQSSNANVSTKYVDRLLEIEGVKEALPVYRYISANSKSRFGIQQLDGVEWEPFARMNDMRLIAGRAAVADDEVILDERQMRTDKVQLGDTIQLFGNKSYKVVGVFAPPSGSRVKMSLKAMQNVLENQDKCTYILVKVKDNADPDEVARRINETLPGNKINLTRDMVIDAQERLPMLNTFLQVLVGLGAVVSTIFVLLSMYTTITERRKEIGILKSLGASKSFIISVIEGEAFLIGILGIVLGSLVSFLSSLAIGDIFELQFEFSLNWVLTAIAIAIGGSLIGALYPALRASDIDPVLVLTNE
jgi:putative ABC transport system permease protein